MARGKSVPAADRDTSTDDNMPPDPLLDGEPPNGSKPLGHDAGQKLKSFIERIERIEGEIKGQREDIREIKAEAKSTGFDVGVINFLIKIRKKDKDDLDEFESVVETYKRAIGMAP